MASAIIYFDTAHPKKDKSCPIIIRLTHNRVPLPIKTGYAVHPDLWDEKNQRIRKSFSESSKANSAIQQKLSKATTFIEKNQHRLYSLSCAQLRMEIMSDRGDDQPDLLKNISIKEAIEMYLKFIRNEGVPEHKIKVRDERYVSEIVRVLNFLKTVIDPDTSIFNITDHHAGQYFKAVKNVPGRFSEKIKSPTFNFYISCVRQFFDYVISKGYKCENHFKGIELRKVKTEPKMVYLEEFQELLQKIDSGESIRQLEYKTKRGEVRIENKTMYKPWLKHGIMLALFGGGRRREEIAFLKWTSVIPNNGKLIGGILYYRNLKSERLKNIQFEDEQLPIEVPITKQLADLLIKMGWKDKATVDEYMLAPDMDNRTYVMYALTKGFQHYYRQIDNPREGISFKCLRKTYITYVRAILADKAKIITGHSKDSTIKDHYEDKKLSREKIAKKLKF